MSILLIADISFSQVKTEEDMAKAVFETIQKNDSEALSFYCTSNKNGESFKWCYRRRRYGKRRCWRT